MWQTLFFFKQCESKKECFSLFKKTSVYNYQGYRNLDYLVREGSWSLKKNEAHFLLCVVTLMLPRDGGISLTEKTHLGLIRESIINSTNTQGNPATCQALCWKLGIKGK